VLATCPYAGKLLDGLLANDVLGFQTAADQRAFLEAAARAGCQTIGDEARDRRGHRTRVHCIPIGVDATALDRDALRPVVEADAERLRADLGLRGQMVLLGVDRLDYTKGIPERLRAFRRLLERHPEHLRRVSFVQIGSPSRGEVPAYRRFQAEVQRLAGDVNRRFGGDGWEPVRLLPTNHEREALLAAYRMATACVVSPLHDGMNLVAKEFVAARPDRNGALVLSRFAGAAHELTDALQIDPRDADVFAESLHRALVLPRPDRRRRMDGMRRAVFERTVYDWAGDLIGTAARISVARPIDKWQRTVFDMTG
jgi:trehalose 6-phosphate synthase